MIIKSYLIRMARGLYGMRFRSTYLKSHWGWGSGETHNARKAKIIS